MTMGMITGTAQEVTVAAVAVVTTNADAAVTSAEALLVPARLMTHRSRSGSVLNPTHATRANPKARLRDQGDPDQGDDMQPRNRKSDPDLEALRVCREQGHHWTGDVEDPESASDVPRHFVCSRCRVKRIDYRSGMMKRRYIYPHG